MPRTMRVEVSPAVFRWLRTSSGWSVEDVARRLRTSVDIIEAIERGEYKPTLRQLKELATAYRRPLAAFLLSEPLKEPPMPKDYRMLPDREGIFDKKTIYAIRRARSLQEVGLELLININDSARPRIKTLRISDNPKHTGLKYRELFGLTPERQRKFKTSYEFFNYLRARLEDMNILVFQFSMPVEDARGFALTDRIPYVVVVNSADSIEARIFTLMHEFGHVLLGDTAIDLPEVSSEMQHRAEKWCNAFASELLLPEKLARTAFESEKSTLTETPTLNSLSRRFKLSKGMISYKMFRLNFISKEAYEEILGRYRPSGPEPGDKKKRGGIPVDVRCISEVGNRFVSIVADNYDRNLITFSDALSYLSVRSKNFESVLAKARQW